eukprot:UN21413
MYFYQPFYGLMTIYRNLRFIMKYFSIQCLMWLNIWPKIISIRHLLDC